MKTMNLVCVVALQTLLLTNVFAQIRIPNPPCGPQIRNAPYSQQPLVNSLLSTYRSPMPFVDKIGAIASVIQKMPPKNPGRANQRQVMAETLKKSALESLMIAANAYKYSKKAEGRTPLPKQQLTLGNDVMANRALNVRYDRYGFK